MWNPNIIKVHVFGLGRLFCKTESVLWSFRKRISKDDTNFSYTEKVRVFWGGVISIVVLSFFGPYSGQQIYKIKNLKHSFHIASLVAPCYLLLIA